MFAASGRDGRAESLAQAEEKITALAIELNEVVTEASQSISVVVDGTVERLKDIRQDLETLRLAEMIRRSAEEA